MATASSEIGSIATGQPSSYIIREAFHDSLADYVRAVLRVGQQTAESESLVQSSFKAILESGSVLDIGWAQLRLNRAIVALDVGDYATIHPHQSNFERMIQALGMQKNIRQAIENAWAG